MAAIIEVISSTGQSLYVTVHNSAAQLANGASTEVYNGSNWSTYVTTVSEQGATGYYTGTFPSYLVAGKYTYVIYQSSGSPTLGDPVLGSGQIYWNGSIEEQGIGLVLAATPVTLAGSQPSLTVGTVTTVTNIGAPGLASIQAQLQALLNATAIPELVGIPASTPTLFQAMMLIYMSLRNSHIATSSQESISNSAGSSIATAQLSDDGSTFTKARFQ